MTHERVREMLQAEVDKQGPLEESRRAAALLAETSIRFIDEPGTIGFVVQGPDGQPRTTIRDGETVPFTLQELAAEIRHKYPMLFKPELPATAVSDEAAKSPPARDWLRLGSGEPDPSNQAASLVPEDLTSPKELPIAAGFRPSHAFYAAAFLAFVLILAFAFWGNRQTNSGSRNAALPRSEAPGEALAKRATAPPSAITGAAEVVDTTTLNVDGKVVRLFGVEWARGAKGEDLISYIGGREVVCTTAVRPDRHRCQIDGRDLSEVVLHNGGGRATPEATPELKAAEEHARAAGLGVWQKP